MSEINPSGAHWYFRINQTGDVLEINALVVEATEWPHRRESKDPQWQPVKSHDGRLVIALKVLG